LVWVIEARYCTHPVGAPGHSCGAREGSDHAARRDLADGVIGGIRDVDVADTVGRYTIWISEARCGTHTIGAPARSRGPCDGGNHACRRDLANGVIEGIRHVDVADTVGRYTSWISEARCGTHTIGAPARSRGPCDGGNHAARRDFPNGIVRG